jgi:hypothetical protein
MLYLACILELSAEKELDVSGSVIKFTVSAGDWPVSKETDILANSVMQIHNGRHFIHPLTNTKGKCEECKYMYN